MNLNEFYKPKINPKIRAAAAEYFKDTLTGDKNLYKNLEKLGWAYLNQGMYSKVFANPKKNYVIKINSRIDEGYQHFVTLIKRNRNKHFPRISDVQQIYIDKKPYFIYLIEKLEPIPEPYNKNYSSFLSDVIDVFMYSDKEPINFFKLFKTLRDEYSHDNEEEVKDRELYLRKNPALIKAAQILGLAAKNSSKYIGIDIHEHNIMERNDGTIIIVDPYVG